MPLPDDFYADFGLYDTALVRVAEEIGIIDGPQEPGRRIEAPTHIWTRICQRLGIANPPDVRSSFAGGRRTIPDVVQWGTPDGYVWHLEYVDGGWWFELKEPALDPFESDEFAEAEIEDLTPLPVVRHIANWDEQMVLEVVGYNNLYGLIGIRHFKVQAHKRTTVDGSQIEVDGLGIGLAGFGVIPGLMIEALAPGEKIVTAEEVKMPHEPFTAMQLQRAARYAQGAFPEHKVLPVAIRPFGRVRAGSPLKALDFVAFGWDRAERSILEPTARLRFVLQQR